MQAHRAWRAPLYMCLRVQKVLRDDRLMVGWIEKHEALVAACVAKLRCAPLLLSARGPLAP